MKTKTLLIAAAALAAGALTSQAQVYSQNIVGYVNVPYSAGYTLIANPLDSGSNTFDNVFSNLPSGSQVLKWTGSTYASFNRTAFGTHWSPSTAGTNLLNPGEGVFVNVSSAMTNTFVGSVISGTVTNSYANGYTLNGNVIPVAGDVTTLGLTDSMPSGSQILTWNPTTQGFVSYNRTAFGTHWSPSVPVLGVGQGYFINANGAFDWVQTVNP